ncbi:hypothetical protein EB232_07190 [Mesorhizobium sp. NZP2077]|nr:hypothetical protein EB232_07190 [Mesorhizobium sp. NZP2077]
METPAPTPDPTALLPYCPTALLPYCPTALLPYCPTSRSTAADHASRHSCPCHRQAVPRVVPW